MGYRRLCCLALALVLASTSAPSRLAAEEAPDFDLVTIPGGALAMGTRVTTPDHRRSSVRVETFALMRTEVTNGQFATFVAASGHLTDAERKGWGYSWDGRWARVTGADWRHPFGPDTNIAEYGDHPVVQVSQRDAAAFCQFYGMRLPSEAEWEFAARHPDGGRFPWGDDPPEARDGSRRANFGTVACCAPDATDGYATTAPVGSFPTGASASGLLDMAGNVWEWTASPYEDREGHVALRGGGWGNNPYCLRVSYRHGNPPDIGLDMVGFRCASGP
jgi:formylglycine-generating enzyme required for sulfatase activity